MATSLQEAFEENVRPFIDIIDELRSLGLEKDVALPAVVVVGDQSAGKSSVLEAISGVELPRGTNIVTRCPLELRLKKLRKNKAHELIGDDETNIQTPWKGAIRYTIEGTDDEVRNVIKEPSMVGPAVEEATERLTKGVKEISDSLIHLEVQSQDVPDLTLIDLPGIARVAVTGQSVDVPAQIKRLITNYIKKDETIILAVVPCNVDIATTEALQLAQEVDPDGLRTLGVLTKPDLVDEGTEDTILQVVNGDKVPLKLGYTVVKCRGQKAIENKLSLKEAMQNEDDFFKNHEILNVLYPEKKTGIRNLSHYLTKQLVEQIKRNMPDLKKDIVTKLSAVNSQLKIYGDMLPDEDYERQNYLVQLAMRLGELFKRLANAEHIDDDAINDLKMYPKIKKFFTEFAVKLNQLRPIRDNSTLKREVSLEINRSKGKELPSFLSYSSFEKIVKKKIRVIEGPASECLKQVNEIVDGVTSIVIQRNLKRFEPLMMEVTRVLNEERKQAEKNTQDALKTIFAMENLVFTQDSHFTQLMQKIEEEEHEEQQKTGQSGFLSSHHIVPKTVRNVMEWFQNAGDVMDAEHMVRCLEAYFQVAVNRLTDTIPMAIYYNLVKQLLEKMGVELIKLTARPETCEKFLREDPEAVFTRKMLLEKQERLERANIKLMKFTTSYGDTDYPSTEGDSDLF